MVTNMTWKVMLAPHGAYGGNATVSAACANCKNSTPAVISNVMWGDVWICSGQSNMELPTHYALTRNRTYNLLDNFGAYQNIRLFERGAHVARWDYELAHSSTFVIPPPQPSDQSTVGFGPGSGWVS